MKIQTKIASLILFVFMSATLQAQIVTDTTRIDTTGAARLRRAILNATSLTGESEVVVLHPNTTRQLCFDLRAVVKADVFSGGSVFFCLYFNSKDGYCAYFKPTVTLNAAMCELNTNDEDFFLTVSNLKGNVFIYSNLKQGNVIKYYVHTGMTERHPYLFFNDSIANPPLLRKIGTRRYCNNKLMGVPYKTDGANTPKFYLNGSIQPAKIRYKKMLGHMGIGFLYGEDGLYFSLQLESAQSTAKVLYLEKKNVCLDVSPFVWREGEELAKMRSEINRKLARYSSPAPAFNGSCAIKQTEQFLAEKIYVNKVNENLLAIENGTINLGENNNNILMAAMAPIEGIDADIANLNVDLCRAQNENQTESSRKRVRCINERIALLNQYKVQAQQILSTNRSNKTKAFGELTMAKAMLRSSNECLMY